VVGIIFSSGIISRNMLLYLPFLNSNDILFRIYYYIGPLLTPATILVLSFIFVHLTSKALTRLKLRAGLGKDQAQISKYDVDKENYLVVCYLVIIAISALTAAALLSYLPNIGTNNIFYKLSFLGGIIGILGLPLTLVG